MSINFNTHNLTPRARHTPTHLPVLVTGSLFFLYKLIKILMIKTIRPCVYILSNLNHTVFYTGFTINLNVRMPQHKAGTAGSFTQKYKVTKLLYVELCDTIEQGLQREKLIKKWSRKVKFDAITQFNPTWRDLSETWL